MNKAITTVVSIVTLAFAGCTTSHFIPYTGAQSDWPTSPGAMMETIDGIPVYHGLPSKPYSVLGEVEIAQQTKLAPSTLGKAASEAKAHGADAVIVLEQGKQLINVSNSGGGTAQVWNNGMVTGQTHSTSHANYGQTARAWLIKFQ